MDHPFHPFLIWQVGNFFESVVRVSQSNFDTAVRRSQTMLSSARVKGADAAVVKEHAARKDREGEAALPAAHPPRAQQFGGGPLGVA